MKHSTVKTGYGLLFLLVWLSVMYYIFFYTSSVRDHGVERPTGPHIVAYINHGDVVYITKEQDFFLKFYGFLWAFSFLCLMILGLVLHFAYDIEIFRGIKTRGKKVSQQIE